MPAGCNGFSESEQADMHQAFQAVERSLTTIIHYRRDPLHQKIYDLYFESGYIPALNGALMASDYVNRVLDEIYATVSSTLVVFERKRPPIMRGINAVTGKPDEGFVDAYAATDCWAPDMQPVPVLAWPEAVAKRDAMRAARGGITSIHIYPEALRLRVLPLPDNRENSLMTVLAHELSHAAAGTYDVGYNLDNVRTAKNNRLGHLNADSYAFFICHWQAIATFSVVPKRILNIPPSAVMGVPPQGGAAAGGH